MLREALHAVQLQDAPSLYSLLNLAYAYEYAGNDRLHRSFLARALELWSSSPEVIRIDLPAAHLQWLRDAVSDASSMETRSPLFGDGVPEWAAFHQNVMKTFWSDDCFV